SSSTSGRIASGPRSMMERPPTLMTCTQGRMRIGCRPATGVVRSWSSRVWRASGEATCLVAESDMSLAPLVRRDDGADVLSVEGTRQVARDQAVDDLHFADVARLFEQIQHRKLE